MDARLGVETVCTRVLPAHTRVSLRDREAQMSQWLMGKSMVVPGLGCALRVHLDA